MKKEILFFIVIAALLGLNWLVPISKPSSEQQQPIQVNLPENLFSGILGGFGMSNQATSTSKDVGTTSTLVTTLTGREQKCYNTGSVAAWLGFGPDAATTTVGGKGMMLFGSSTAAGDTGILHYNGPLYAATRSGVTEISCVSFQ